MRVLVSTAAPVCMRLTRHALTHHTFSPLSLCPTADLSAAQPRSTITMPGGGGGKTRIGDLELASIPPKYGPYLALPAGPEPAVWRLAPKTGRSGPNAGHTRVAHPGGDGRCLAHAHGTLKPSLGGEGPGSGPGGTHQYKHLHERSAVLLKCLSPWATGLRPRPLGLGPPLDSGAPSCHSAGAPDTQPQPRSSHLLTEPAGRDDHNFDPDQSVRNLRLTTPSVLSSIRVPTRHLT